MWLLSLCHAVSVLPGTKVSQVHGTGRGNKEGGGVTEDFKSLM